MEQLDDYVSKKRKIAAHYCEALQHVTGIAPMKNAPWAESTFWMYTILIDEKEFPKDSRQMMHALGAQKIQCRPLWQPIHRSPAHASGDVVDLPVADRLVRQALSLPCSVGLSELDQDRVIAALLK
jgi:perosamine synthetase